MTITVLLFAIEDRRIAVPVRCVERIIPAAAITPLGHAPAQVLGVLNIAGTVVPVLSLRQRLGLTEPPLDPAGHFILLDLGDFSAAISIDRVEGCRTLASAAQTGELSGGQAGSPSRPGHISLGDWTAPELGADEDGVILIEEPASFLGAGERAQLAEALEAQA
jgi:purine-binding chemotaxis protein CheW